MKQAKFRQVIILSAELSELNDSNNLHRSDLLESCLNSLNITFNESEGYYKGRKEVSFVTLPKNDDELQAIIDLAFINFSQESIIKQDTDGKTFIIYNDGDCQEIGRLKRVETHQIKEYDGYTRLNGVYYAAS